MKKIYFVLFLSSVACFSPLTALAEDPAGDERLRQAKLEADIATQRAIQAEKEAAALKSRFPTTPVDAKLGTLEVGKEYAFPPLVLAYSASEQLVAALAAQITVTLNAPEARLPRPTRVLIYQANDSLIAQRAVYTQLLSRLKSITERLNDTEENFIKIREGVEVDPKKAAAEYVQKATDALASPTPPSSMGRNVIPALGGLEAANAGITAATSTVQAVIQLISLFHSETKIIATDVTIDIDGLCAQFGNSLKACGLPVAYPSLLWNGTESPILKAFTEMIDKQSDASRRTTEIDSLLIKLGVNQPIIEEQIKLQLPLGNPPSEELAKKVQLATAMAKGAQQVNSNGLTALKLRVAALDPLASALDKSLQTPDDKTGMTALSTIIKTEALINALDDRHTYSLLLKVLAGGGATKTDRNLFTGTRITHLGGAIFVATLTTSTGKILYTNVSKGFLGYAKMKSTGGIIQQDLQPAKSQSRFVR